MQQHLITIGSIAGGIGLFLLAVSMITNGLKMSAGHALRRLLGHWTRTPIRGIASGIGITALVQSSSAVTVATIGFVNAGLLNLNQALGVIYGANIGTTITGWLVTIVGFDIQIEFFALPMIGLGMFLKLMPGGGRIGAIGETLAGFGLFFIGINVLRMAFEGMASSIDLMQFQASSLQGLVLFTGIGFIMTVLMQSSSAAIVIIFTATTGGFIVFDMAAAMVIGANVGTTVTASIVAIGASPSAKRVASAHVIFNLLTGFVALLILPLMIQLVIYSQQLLDTANMPTISLALFHTIFNILGVLLIWPLTGRMTNFLLQHFRSHEEIEGTPRFLDKTAIATPELAMIAITMEIGHVNELVQRMVKGSISTESFLDKQLQGDHDAIKRLIFYISEFIKRVEKTSLTNEVVEQLPKALHALQNYTDAEGIAYNYANTQGSIRTIEDEDLQHNLDLFKAESVSLFEFIDPCNPEFDRETCKTTKDSLHHQYHQLRDQLFWAGSSNLISLDVMNKTLEQINRVDRMIKQLSKGAHALNSLLISSEHLESVQKDRGEESSEEHYPREG